jgi:AcrR family transcriptional regulator
VYSHFDSRDDLIQACVFRSTANGRLNERRLEAVLAVHGPAELLSECVAPPGNSWRRQRVEALLASIGDARLASAVLQAGLEAEADIVRRARPIGLEGEFALRQLLRFHDVIITGACIVPEVSGVMADIDWRHAVSPFHEVAMREIFPRPIWPSSSAVAG